MPTGDKITHLISDSHTSSRMNSVAQPNPLFRLHFPSHIDEQKGTPPLIALGMLSWGTISILDRSRILSEKQAHEIYQTFRSHGVVIYDTAEGYGCVSSVLQSIVDI